MDGHLVGFGAYDSQPVPFQQIGSPIHLWELSSPGAALYRHSLGQEPQAAPDAGTTALGVGALLLIVGVAVAVNYQLGKAMAPDKQSERTWAIGNAIGGTVFPPVTLGMALYKNYFR